MGLVAAVGEPERWKASESQIAEWRAYVAHAPGVNGRDVDELEDHLRQQIADLNAVGLSADEAFLVAVKRMGDVDVLSREFAREHSGRLWKRLLVSGDDEPARASRGWVEMLVFAVAAALAIQIARLAADFPDEEPNWFFRNLSLFVLPFLAGCARAAGSTYVSWVVTAAPFVVAALVINLYPWDADSNTEILAALHLPVVLWFVIAFPYMGGTLRSRAAHGLRAVHRRVVRLLRADRARGRRAHGTDRGHPRAHGDRSGPDRRMEYSRRARRAP